MEKNIGTADKIIRVIIGIVALIAGVYLQGWWLIAGIIICVAMILTAFVGWCGLYSLLGVSTCPVKK